MYPQRKRNRLLGFDYTQHQFYFISSNVKNHEPYFGEVIKGEMQLNANGEIVKQRWLWLAQQYPFVRLHAFIIMPEHMHGIIEILPPAVPTSRDLSVQLVGKIKSLSELMGAFKTTSSKQIHLAGYPNFSWHRSFHDSILFDRSKIAVVERYIRMNPANYKKSK